jgi:hypothetical protein
MTRPSTAASPEIIESLHAAIAHGDEDHRAWLKDAINAHFAGQPIPAPRGMGTKERRIAELEEALGVSDEVMREALTEARRFIAYREIDPVIADGESELLAKIDLALTNGETNG